MDSRKILPAKRVFPNQTTSFNVNARNNNGSQAADWLKNILEQYALATANDHSRENGRNVHIVVEILESY